MMPHAAVHPRPAMFHGDQVSEAARAAIGQAKAVALQTISLSKVLGMKTSVESKKRRNNCKKH